MGPTATIGADSVNSMTDGVVAEKEISALNNFSMANSNCDPVFRVFQNSELHFWVLEFQRFFEEGYFVLLLIFNRNNHTWTKNIVIDEDAIVVDPIDVFQQLLEVNRN